jgi:CRP-like cAMP-binding protein
VDPKDLAPVPLFAGLSARERAQVARLADVVDVLPGTHLLDFGALPHEFLVLLTGAAEVSRGEDVIATLGPGDFFGEIAILEHGRRTATVTASEPCKVAVMTDAAFAAMRDDLPAVAAMIEDAAVARMPD